MMDDWLKIIVLTAIFGAVVIAIEMAVSAALRSRQASSAINARLRMIEGGMARAHVMQLLRRDGAGRGMLPGVLGAQQSRLQARLAQAGITTDTARLSLLLLAAPAVLFALFMLLSAVFGAPFGIGRVLLFLTLAVALGLGVPMMVISMKANRRRRKMEEQFPVALDVFVRGLRAGHPIAAALDLLTVEMADPIGSQFGIVVDEVTYGADLRDALENMADRWDIDDIRMFVVSLSVQNETGGNLAEILENLSRVIRERQSMFLKVRALSSEGRISAWMLSVLPLGTFLLIFLTKPSFFLDVADDPLFVPGFAMLLGLYAFGVWVIRKMIDLKV